MNSSIIGILEILNTAKTLSSVGFSAGYNSDEKQVNEFFYELAENANSTNPIFSGIIIFEKTDYHNQFKIVDGMQRLTTIVLLLAALCKVSKNSSQKNEEARQKILTRYLTNKNDIKFQLLENENNILKKIILSEELTVEETKSNLFNTFENFVSKIANNEITPMMLFKTISRIRFLVVLTEPNDIPTRELYQSMNENKKDFSQINLITDYIFQSSFMAKEIWSKAISTYKRVGLSDLLKDFLRDFLTIQNNGQIPNEESLYKNFKSYYNKISKYQSPENIAKNLYRYSEFYLKIIQADFEDFEIKKLITMINENDGKDTYPYLMEVLDDLENSHIEREVVVSILTMINSFLIQRNEGETDNNMNFACLSNELNKMLAMKNNEQKIEDDVAENKLTINQMNNLSNFDV